jgi:hypothetical protein
LLQFTIDPMAGNVSFWFSGILCLFYSVDIRKYRRAAQQIDETRNTKYRQEMLRERKETDADDAILDDKLRNATLTGKRYPAYLSPSPSTPLWFFFSSLGTFTLFTEAHTKS